MPDIRDDLDKLRRMAWACDQSGNTERAAHYRRLIAWIATADEAMRAVVGLWRATGSLDRSPTTLADKVRALRAALLPEVER